MVPVPITGNISTSAIKNAKTTGFFTPITKKPADNSAKVIIKITIYPLASLKTFSTNIDLIVAIFVMVFSDINPFKNFINLS